jgi:acyl-CoA dehydrogenase
VNFEFSSDQALLREQLRRFFEANCPPPVARAALTDPAAGARIWSALGELGVLGAAIPEEFGGVGIGYLELCVLAEEAGRARAPVPLASSLFLAAEALQLVGTAEQKQRYLPALASGRRIGAFVAAHAPRSTQVTHRDGALYGVSGPVLDAGVAHFCIVPALDEGVVSLFAVDIADARVSQRRLSMLDPTRDAADLVFEGAPCERVGASGEGESIAAAVADRAAALIAFEQLGGAQMALDMALEHVKQRYAFGRPVGSFQAVKHALADVYVDIELARSNCYFGAWALATGAPELPLAAATARIAAGSAYRRAAAQNIQAHGGMGFTWDSDCHLHYRRACLLALAIGAEPVWQERLVRQLELAA